MALLGLILALPIGISVDGTPKEKAKLTKAIVELQKAPVIQEREKRRRRFDAKFRVAFSTRTGDGAWGRYFHGDKTAFVAVSTTLAVSTGPQVLDTLAHEIYGHGVVHLEAENDDIVMLAENEALSMAVAGNALCELGHADHQSDAMLVAVGTVPYYASVLFTAGDEKLALSRCEARNASYAVDKRLDELARRRTHIESWDKGVPRWRWLLDHFQAGHGVSTGALAGLRSHLDDFERQNGERRQLLAKATRLHEDMRAWLAGADGASWEARLSFASYLPGAKALEEEVADYAGRLTKCLDESKKPPPPAGPSEAWGWDEAVKQLDSETEEHIKSAPEGGGDPPPWELPDGGHLAVCPD